MTEVNCRRRQSAVVARALMVVHLAGAAHAKGLALTPHEIPEGATNIRLRVQRADGRAFTSRRSARLSVGIAFGTKLVMFEAKPDPPQAPQTLTVTIKDPSLIWSEPPRAGDQLLVAVYLNNNPITAATPLPVVGRRS